MGEVSIAVELREGRGKEFNRKLRAAGRIPAIVYGRGNESVALSLDPVPLDRSLKTGHAGLNTLFDLVGDNSLAGRTVLVKELQRDPIGGALLHADFYEIDANESIQVSVPVRLIGDAAGANLGGVIEHVLREVELACLPNAIPDEITVDVSGLDLGQSLHVSDLVLPTGAELVTDETLSVVSVMLPRAMEEEVAPVAEEGEEEAVETGEEDTEKPAEDGEGD